MSTVLITRDLNTNVSSPITSEPIQGHAALLLATHILHIIGGQVLLPILLITLFIGGEARKNPLLANFCFSWIFFSAVWLILFYGGTSVSNNPPIQLCLIQASLNYGAQAMTVITSLGVVVQAWYHLRVSTVPNVNPRIYGWKTTLLVTSSYVALVAFSTTAIVIGVGSPQDVGRTYNIFVCDIAHHKLATAVGWLCGAIGFCVAVLGTWILAIIYRNRHTIQYWRLYRTSSDFGLILRTLAFIFYGLIIVIMSLLSVYGFNTDFAYTYIAALPLITFLIFGTRRVTTRLWRKWLHLPLTKRSRRESEAFPTTSSQHPAESVRPTRPRALQTRQSEMSFLERQQQPRAPFSRRGRSDVVEIFDLRDDDLQRAGPSVLDIGTDDTSRPETQLLFQHETDESGDEQMLKSEKKKVKRPPAAELISEPFLPIAMRFQSDTEPF